MPIEGADPLEHDEVAAAIQEIADELQARRSGVSGPPVSCAGEAAKFRLTFAGRSDPAATELDRLTRFAESMCNAGVARLKFGAGHTRPRLGLLPVGEKSALLHIYNEQGRLGVYVCLYRSVFQRAAPSSVSSVEAAAGRRIGHGNEIHDVSDRLLDAIEAALHEALSA
jgi:hypothetical protein